MAKDLPNVQKVTGQPRKPGSAPGPGAGPCENSCVAADLEWADAVHAAAARLSETSVVPATEAGMVESGLADEFAATLCAYGLASDEVAHHAHDRTADPLAEPTAPEDRHVTPSIVPGKPTIIAE